MRTGWVVLFLAVAMLAPHGSASAIDRFPASIATGWYHTVGLKPDATVVAAGCLQNREQCSVSGWTGIRQVAAGAYHTVGLKSDGTVVAAGCGSPYYYGQCSVSGWSGIIQVAAGTWHTVGLKYDGTVVAGGCFYYDEGQCNVSGWSGIVQVAAGEYHTVGLKADGTVVATGFNNYGQCNVSSWSGIVQVAASNVTVGLKADGTAVAVGYRHQLDVGGWTGIVQVAAGLQSTLGLKADGTLAVAGCWGWDYGQCNVTGWSGLLQVAQGCSNHNAGLKADGSAVAVGLNSGGQLAVGGWSLTTRRLFFTPCDFNGDNKPDLLWRHGTTGAIATWLMDGVTMIPPDGVAIATIPDTSWQIVGVADFNGDGSSDLLWRSSSGAMAVWYMSGMVFVSLADMGTVDAYWEIAGTPDLNGDGKPDLLWHHRTSGAVAAWTMDGLTMSSAEGISIGAVPDPDWRIAGTPDLNGDGKPDILWQHIPTGTVAVWYMNGTTMTSSAVITAVGPDWQAVGTADFNADGKPDILWRNPTTGEVAVWFMDGASLSSAVVIATVDPDWELLGPK